MVKIIRLLITIALISGAYYWNNVTDFLPNFQFTGVVLLAWLILGLIGVGITKIYKNKRGIPQEKHSYSLPDAMAKMMKSVDLRTQYEASIMSTFLIMIGITSMAIYFIFFFPVSITFKILTGLNSLFGLMFMYSNLVTVYQQYVIYMQTQDMMDIGVASGEMLPADFGGMNVKVDTESAPVVKVKDRAAPKEEPFLPEEIDDNINERRDSKNA